MDDKHPVTQEGWLALNFILKHCRADYRAHLDVYSWEDNRYELKRVGCDNIKLFWFSIQSMAAFVNMVMNVWVP